jgi:hypothetical protein
MQRLLLIACAIAACLSQCVLNFLSNLAGVAACRAKPTMTVAVMLFVICADKGLVPVGETVEIFATQTLTATPHGMVFLYY